MLKENHSEPFARKEDKDNCLDFQHEVSNEKYFSVCSSFLRAIYLFDLVQELKKL